MGQTCHEIAGAGAIVVTERPVNLFGQQIGTRGEVLGCDGCPLNGVPGICKVKGLSRIRGKRAMLWAQQPGKTENAKGLELVGPAGQLLWKTARTAGLEREDFDVQNVLRCWSIDEHGVEHEPTKRELACCSVYNDEALDRNAGRAAAHLILGDVAGEQLLGSSYRKDKPVFWYVPWNAYVVLNRHPSYILRIGGERAGWEYRVWRERFRAVRAIMANPGRWGYVKSQNYYTVMTLDGFDKMERAVRAEASTGRRVSFDLEDGRVNDHPVVLMAGFGTGRFRDPKDMSSWQGKCWSVVLDHPEARYEITHAAAMRNCVKRLIEDGGVRKALQNGSYDSNKCRDLLGAQLRGYDYDTQYGTWLRHSFLRSCSLENLTYLFFPEFCDYKDTVGEWMGNLAEAPLDRLLLRNAGDCDLTKRLEERFKEKVPYELLQVYIHAAFTLDEMEGRGPLLDREEWEKASRIVPELMERLDTELRQASGRPDFDCDSPQQVAWLLYDHLKLPLIAGNRSTGKEVLLALLIETENPLIETVQHRRALGVAHRTFLKGYDASARRNGGELRTIWWLTGAVTGRLRGGKGDRAEAEGIVNFQNLHGNPLLQRLLVSDPNWRKAL